VIERRSKVLPTCGVSSRIVGREYEGHHVEEPKPARSSDQNSEHKRQPNRQLAIRDEKSDGRCMRQHDPLENRKHERVGAPILQEAVDPPFKPPTPRELCTKDFVLREDQKETAHRDP